MLRDHQITAIDMVKEELRKGNKRVILAAPCSFGKTITSVAIAQSAVAKGKRVLFICDRIKLVEQALEAYDKHGLHVGVLQGQHWRIDYTAPIQIASVQTLARRQEWPHIDLIVIDEAHTIYKSVEKQLERWDNLPVIGLTATPYSKGLGKVFDSLVVPITTRELIKKGWLCPTDYYVGKSVDTTGVSMKAVSTGGSDYDPDELGEKMLEGNLTGDIVENYRKHSNNLTRRAIAFCPSIEYSKNLVDRLNDAGIPSAHIDGYTPDDERALLYADHREGITKVLSCSKLLGVGYDDPGVEILIDCYKTKSALNFVQRAGRIWRICEGKEKATYLDHSGNLLVHGYPEDIVPTHLDDGEKRYQEKTLLKKDTELLEHVCPECTSLFKGRRCDCGYVLPGDAKILKDDGTELVLADGETLVQMKQRWFSELLEYAHDKGYNLGWVSHKYRQKFGVWPRNIDRVPELCQSADVLGFIKSQRIAWARSPRRTSHARRDIASS